jgi:hypothetical protein
VTEAEWLVATDPQPMLSFLRGKAGDRKLRLFACACCRSVWQLLPYELSRRAVEVSERYADGLAGTAELQAALAGAEEVRRGRPPREGGPAAAVAATSACPKEAADETAEAVITANAWPLDSQAGIALGMAESERQRQSGLLRDILGNPFRPVSAIDPVWLAWNGGTVMTLAEAAYEARSLPEGSLDIARLALISDALEDAGCSDPGLLGHLRSPGPHVRGCWAIDLLLGKE